MKPLIDADILRYEIGFGSEYVDDDGNRTTRDYDFMTELLDEKIRVICEEVGATEEPLLFLTNDSTIIKLLKMRGEELEKIPNFRDEIAVTKIYKGQRLKNKPLHFNNITAYILDNYEYKIANGIEADDLMCIEQTKRLDSKNTIICSRDKDLRICQGLHYSWECGKQAAIGPMEVDKVGHITLKRDASGKPSVFGTGLSFFYSQLITGDTADNIPGLPNCGAVSAVNVLKGIDTEESLFTAVKKLYQEKCGDDWEEYMTEQANLLWMIQEVEDDVPVMYKFPEV